MRLLSVVLDVLRAVAIAIVGPLAPGSLRQR